MTVIHHSPYLSNLAPEIFFCFPDRLKITLEHHLFNMVELIHPEIQELICTYKNMMVAIGSRWVFDQKNITTSQVGCKITDVKYSLPYGVTNILIVRNTQLSNSFHIIPKKVFFLIEQIHRKLQTLAFLLCVILISHTHTHTLTIINIHCYLKKITIWSYPLYLGGRGMTIFFCL